MYITTMSSPYTASGMGWVINCFLELNILCYRNQLKDDTWERFELPAGYRKKGYTPYSLTKLEHLLQPHLPTLMRRQQFLFRDDVLVHWGHDYPDKNHPIDKVILVVRDPRDAMLSIYNRPSKPWSCSFREYIEWIDYATFLSKIDDWIFFNQCWLQFPNVHIVRFEEYKNDPKQTLQNILDFCELEYPEAMLDKALCNSTSEKSKLAEKKYYQMNPSIQQTYTANGPSKVNRFEACTDLSDTMEDIYRRTSSTMKSLGYCIEDIPPPNNQPNFTDYCLYESNNPFLENLPEFIIAKAIEGKKSPSGFALLHAALARFIDSEVWHSEENGGQYYKYWMSNPEGIRRILDSGLL